MVWCGALALACSFAPARFLKPWTGELGEVAWIPFMPLGLVMGQARAWLRPPIPELELQSPLAQQLIRERNAYRGLYHSMRIETERLVRELDSVSRARLAVRDDRTALVPASVVGVDGAGRNPLIRIGQGASAGIQAGDVAIFGGDSLVGRVVSPVGRAGCSVLPVWSPRVGRIDARAKDPVGGVDLPVQVSVLASGSIVAQAPSGIELPRGTEILLDDREWPAEAQGMLIGTVVKIELPDEAPLQRRHVLRPAAPTKGLDVVVIKFSRLRTAP